MTLFTQRFLTPGPTPIPERVRAAMQTVHGVHHRSELFSKFLRQCRNGLQSICGSDFAPVLVNASGTGGLEAAIYSWIFSGDHVAVLNGGKFGERLSEIAASKGASVEEYLWNPSSVHFDLQNFEKWITGKKSSGLKAFMMQANETSTGAFYPVQEISTIVRKVFPDVLFLVDGISALIAHPLSCKESQIDILIGASQKGFGVPTGLSFVAISTRAQAALEKRINEQAGVYYFDLKREFLVQESKASTAWTFSFELLVGMCASLDLIEEMGGVVAMNSHHRELALKSRAGLRAMGFTCYIDDSLASQALTSFSHPTLNLETVSQKLVRDHKIVVAGGQDELKGKILRLSHLGYVDQYDLIPVMAALGQIAVELGQLSRKEVAVGVEAFLNW